MSVVVVGDVAADGGRRQRGRGGGDKDECECDGGGKSAQW
jgi:hypothetical protein